MNDIIKHHLIPLAPIEFLDVCEWTRSCALKYVGSDDVRRKYGEYYCDEMGSRYGLYYRIVRLLGEAEMHAELTTFTHNNFDEIYFGIRVWRLLMSGDKATVFGFYKYIKHHDYGCANSMIDIFKLRFSVDDMDNIKEYITDHQYHELKNYYNYGVRFSQEPSHHGKFWRMRNGGMRYSLRQ